MATYTNPNQLKAIHVLIGKNHLRDEKESIVESFTAGRTKHVSEMYGKEAAALIGHLKSLDETDKRTERMRNKVLSMAHEMNWRIAGTNRVDMDHVNNWCLNYGYKKRRLDDYTYEELPMLVTQFEQLYKSHLKEV